MHLLFWHGYLLTHTGSNIFTRELVRACHRSGHEVTLLCQDPDAADHVDDGVRVVRPPLPGDLPVFVVDTYPDVVARHVGDFTDQELELYIEANATAVRDAIERSQAGPHFVVANHAVMGGPVARRACLGPDVPYGVYLHGSELEYAIRDRPHLGAMARAALDDASVTFVGSAHIAAVAEELLGRGPYLSNVELLPAGVDVAGFHPDRGSMATLIRSLRSSSGEKAHTERSPDPDAADRLAEVGRFVLYAGKLIPQKGVDLVIDAWRELAPRHRDMHLVVVGFGPDRATFEQRAEGLPVVFTGALAHEELQRLMPLAEVVVVPSKMHEAFGMIAAEAAACGVVPLVARHSGLAEVADGLGEAGSTFDGTADDLVATLGGLLDLPTSERRRLGATARTRAVERWSWETIAQKLVELISAAGRA